MNTTAPAPRARIPRRPLHGVLLLDKPVGLSSHDALYKAKRLLRAEKAGHTGTLDPLASGLLPLAFGAATKFSQAQLEAPKAYRATLALGVTTTTGDREGTPVDEKLAEADRVDRAAAEAACAAFSGEIDQLPPMHSALKRDGKPLYEYARAGIEVERTPRRVSIHAIDIVALHDRELVIDVRCSKGTYIRTLAEDIGRRLGCGAHLAALRRTGSGGFALAQAVTLERLAELDEAGRDALLLAPDALLHDSPPLALDGEEAGRFLAGMRRRVARPDASQVRVYGPEPGAFLGSAHVTAGELIADRLLSPIELRELLSSRVVVATQPRPVPNLPEVLS